MGLPQGGVLGVVSVGVYGGGVVRRVGEEEISILGYTPGIGAATAWNSVECLRNELHSIGKIKST